MEHGYRPAIVAKIDDDATDPAVPEVQHRAHVVVDAHSDPRHKWGSHRLIEPKEGSWTDKHGAKQRIERLCEVRP